MKNNATHYGLFLAIITIAFFLGIYFFFVGFNYYYVSIVVNAFILPIIYVITAIVLLFKLSKIKVLAFSEGFKNSFITMALGGSLSVIFMFIFLNFFDPKADELLQHQRIEYNLSNIEKEYNQIKDPTEEQKKLYKELSESMNSIEVRQSKLSSIKNAFTFLASINLFYLLISVFLGLFFRSKRF